MMRLLIVAALLIVVVTGSAARASERAPVLSQVTAPHSYYWREMYIPQLTSGPSSLAWAPDGKSLYFSMRGRIWRQRIDNATALQITSGDYYDYEPDISPDGRRLAFSRRDGDTIDLVIRDLKNGKETAIARNGAVNIDARWSPDGEKIAFVTTAVSGNFHIEIAEESAVGWTAHRWRAEQKTAAKRYYYSQVDHELSPDWSPDGKWLVFVSNADIIHGTGNIVRQPLDLSSPPEIIREEETNWKAHPDWSPDGKRIVYSSYFGRQRHQLWMTIPEPGGYPMPFSFGDFDVTNARWSPDGKKIAFISNEAGGLRLEIVDVVGGKRVTLPQKSLRRIGDTATLAVNITDANGEPAPARVEIKASDGRDYAPSGALIHADDYLDPARGVETHYFHSNGGDEISLPLGRAEIRIWRGLASTPVKRALDIRKGRNDISISLDDLSNDFAGWKSADVHVHMNYGGAYRIVRDGLAAQANAEALDLAFNLIVNKEQRIPDIAEYSTVPARPSGGHATISEGQEFHTSLWGHLGLLGLQEHFLIPDYVAYPQTAVASPYPDNATIEGLAHEQGALVGYVHPYDPPAPDPSSEGALTHTFPADVALGLVDYVEVVGFSDHRTTEEVWRRLLNCGFRIPAAGGTDAMTNYASMRGPIGLDRTYVFLGADVPEDPTEFTRVWLAGLKAGRSFATNSALLSLAVDGKVPGDELKFAKGAHTLKFSARMESIAAIKSLDLIVNGAVVQKLPVTNGGRSASAEGEVTIDRSGWITLRASSDEASPDVFDLYPFAVTSPIYVTVGGKPVRSRDDADYFLAWIDKLIDYAEKSDAYNTRDERAAVLTHFRKARKEFERRR